MWLPQWLLFNVHAPSCPCVRSALKAVLLLRSLAPQHGIWTHAACAAAGSAGGLLPPRPPCRKWLARRCSYGPACFYGHPPLPPPDPHAAAVVEPPPSGQQRRNRRKQKQAVPTTEFRRWLLATFGADRMSGGGGSRRRDCHFAGTPCTSLLKHLLKVEGGVGGSRMTVSPTAI